MSKYAQIFWLKKKVLNQRENKKGNHVVGPGGISPPSLPLYL